MPNPYDGILVGDPLPPRLRGQSFRQWKDQMTLPQECRLVSAMHFMGIKTERGLWNLVQERDGA